MRKCLRVASGLLMLAACLQARAADSSTLVTTFVLHLMNGETHSFRLPDTPVVTFDESDIIVSSAVAEFSHVRSDVEHMDFGKDDAMSGLSGNTDYDNDFSFSFTDNCTVEISGNRVASASVCSVSGATVVWQQAYDGAVNLDVSMLPPGVYVVVIPNYDSVKIIKK